jgi:antitoxin component YwqK of YwqJK toxin-antitoxin module
MKFILFKLFFGVLFLLKTSMASCQTDSLVYFFDKDYNFCKAESLVYVGIGIKEKGMIKFSNYINATGILVSEGYFTDSTLAVKEGVFIFYDSLGYKVSEGGFYKNKEEGPWLEWKQSRLNDTIYKLSDSSYYENGHLISRVSFQYHSNDRLSSRNFQDYQKKIKDISMWDDKGTLTSKVFWIDGTGDQTFYYENGNIKSISHSQKGKHTSTKQYNEDGSEMSKQELKKREEDFANRMKEIRQTAEKNQPRFPGGSAGFISYLEHHIKFPESFLNQIQPGEKIKISFRLNQDGFAYDIEVLEFENYDLQQAVANAFKNMPAWNMNGHKKFGPITYMLNVSRF